MRQLAMGSLFAGVGAFELAGRRNGIRTLWNCEIDPDKRQILKKNFPDAIQYADIRDVHHPPRVDILTGGWPCQDNSNANQSAVRQSGLDGSRSGLFFEYARLIRQIRPTLVLGENTPDILTVNGGRDFNRILSELAQVGYDASWGIIRASDLGAPHHRARLYMVAHPGSVRLPSLVSVWKDVRTSVVTQPRHVAGAFVAAGGTWGSAEPPVLRVDDGTPARLDIPRIHGCGNAVVADIPEVILKQLLLHWPHNQP